MEKGRIAQTINTARNKIIEHQLRPETPERTAYENTLSRYIKYFQSAATISELKQNKIRFANADANGDDYDVAQSDASRAEYIITATDKESDPSRAGRSLVVTYDDQDQLQGFHFFGADNNATDVVRDHERGVWRATRITADSLSGVATAKQEMRSRADEMHGFLRDFYLSYIPKVEGLSNDAIQNMNLLNRFKEDRQEEIEKRLFLPMTRREFLKTVGVIAAGALFLAACGVSPDSGSGGNTADELKSKFPELQAAIESGAIDEARNQEVDRAEIESLGPGAKGVLYTFLASKEGEAAIAGSWEKVATPDFLKSRGVVAGSDINEIFRFKQRNGGYLFYDQQSNRYFKVAEAGTRDAEYLKQSAANYRNGWTAAGVPEEVVAKVQVIDSFTYEGKSSVLLSAPNMGQTLETYTKFLKVNNAANADAILSSMLERYYIDTLMPMNAAGVFQKDPNFKNICLFQQADGSVKLVPIDLAQKPMAFEQAQIFQTQYDELALRALGNGRNVKMPSFTEFLQKYPDIARQMNIMAQMGETVRLNITLPGEAAKVLVVVPQNLLGGSEQSGAVTTNIVRTIQKQYGEAYRNLPQGSLMPIEVTLEDGSISRFMVIKANPIGDPIAKFGGKWAEVLQLGKTGFKVMSDFLFIMWIATEIGELTDPDYSAKLFSDIAFPDSVSWTDNASAAIDDIYSRLMGAKDKLVTDTAQMMHPSAVAEQMFGVTQKELLDLITKRFMTQGEIIQVLSEQAKRAAFPPAPAQVEFQSPFPILVDEAELPVSAMFSAFQSDNDQQVVLFWGQTEGADKKPVTMPITAFQKNPGDKSWTTVPIIDKPWSVKFNIRGEQFTLTCKSAQNDGSRFELQCFK